MTYLPNLHSCLFLLDLDLNHVTRVPNDLRYIGLVSPKQLFPYSFCQQVAEASIHQPLPNGTMSKATNADTVERLVVFDHAADTVKRQNDKKHHEKMVSVIETFIIGMSKGFE